MLKAMILGLVVLAVSGPAIPTAAPVGGDPDDGSADPGSLVAADILSFGSPENRYALLVGVADYPAGISDIPPSANDLLIMKQVLTDHYGFPAENIVTMKDSDASAPAIIRTFKQHLGQAGPQGVAVFYYSGHGTRLEGNVLAQDPEPDGRDEALAVYGTTTRDIFIVDDVLGSIAAGLNAARVLLILDSCNSGTGSRLPSTPSEEGVIAKEVPFELLIKNFGPFDESELAGEFDSASMEDQDPDGLSDAIGIPTTHLLLTAARADELSYGAYGWPKWGGSAGVFTYYLADGLIAASEFTTFQQMMTAVRANAVAWSRACMNDTTVPLEDRCKNIQTPQVEGISMLRSVRAYLR